MEAALRTAYELATGEGVAVWYGWAVGKHLLFCRV